MHLLRICFVLLILLDPSKRLLCLENNTTTNGTHANDTTTTPTSSTSLSTPDYTPSRPTDATAVSDNGTSTVHNPATRTTTTPAAKTNYASAKVTIFDKFGFKTAFFDPYGAIHFRCHPNATGDFVIEQFCPTQVVLHTVSSENPVIYTKPFTTNSAEEYHDFVTNVNSVWPGCEIACKKSGTGLKGQRDDILADREGNKLVLIIPYILCDDQQTADSENCDTTLRNIKEGKNVGHFQAPCANSTILYLNAPDCIGYSADDSAKLCSDHQDHLFDQMSVCVKYGRHTRRKEGHLCKMTFLKAADDVTALISKSSGYCQPAMELKKSGSKGQLVVELHDCTPLPVNPGNVNVDGIGEGYSFNFMGKVSESIDVLFGSNVIVQNCTVSYRRPGDTKFWAYSCLSKIPKGLVDQHNIRIFNEEVINERLYTWSYMKIKLETRYPGRSEQYKYFNFLVFDGNKPVPVISKSEKDGTIIHHCEPDKEFLARFEELKIRLTIHMHLSKTTEDATSENSTTSETLTSRQSKVSQNHDGTPGRFKLLCKLDVHLVTTLQTTTVLHIKNYTHEEIFEYTIPVPEEEDSFWQQNRTIIILASVLIAILVSLIVVLVLLAFYFARRRRKRLQTTSKLIKQMLRDKDNTVGVLECVHYINDNSKECAKLLKILTTFSKMQTAHEAEIKELHDEKKAANVHQQRYKDMFILKETAIPDETDGTPTWCAQDQTRKPSKQPIPLGGNYVKDLYGATPFIITEAPSQENLQAFLRCIMRDNVAVVVTIASEPDMKSLRVFPYYREDTKLGKMKGVHRLVFSKSGPVLSNEAVEVRSLHVRNTKTKEDHNFRHVLYKMWLDYSAANDYEHITMIKKFTDKFMEKVDADDADTEARLLVHCSAGVGRSGTLVCSYMAIDLVRKNFKEINIPAIVNYVRSFRLRSVQKKEQFETIFKVVGTEEESKTKENLEVLDQMNKKKPSTDATPRTTSLPDLPPSLPKTASLPKGTKQSPSPSVEHIKN